MILIFISTMYIAIGIGTITQSFRNYIRPYQKNTIQSIRTVSQMSFGSSFVNLNLEQLFKIQDFLDLYKTYKFPIKGVFSIENVTDGNVQIVESSMNIYNEVVNMTLESKYNDFHGIRIQTFKVPNINLMNSYKNKLLNQIKSIENNKRKEQIDFIDKPITQIVSPFIVPTDLSKSNTEGIIVKNEREIYELNVENVNKVLDKIRSLLISDGGNVSVFEVDISERTIKLILEGACGSCPSSTTTMKMGIEKVLKEHFANLKSITSVDANIALSPTLNLLRIVTESLKKILPAIESLGGILEVDDVDALTGSVYIKLTGPEKLKLGVERVLKDNIIVKSVIFK